MVTSKRPSKSKPAPKADASQVRPGHTELFLPEELEDFFDVELGPHIRRALF